MTSEVGIRVEPHRPIFSRAIKWTGTCESIRPTLGSSQVGLKFFYKFQYG